jgi:magnesium-transporting ATPase (P-type)
VLGEQEWREWNAAYRSAASQLEDREARVAAVAEKIERNLCLVGITAIEDKLQEGVPEAIDLLITAGIKVG